MQLLQTALHEVEVEAILEETEQDSRLPGPPPIAAVSKSLHVDFCQASNPRLRVQLVVEDQNFFSYFLQFFS